MRLIKSENRVDHKLNFTYFIQTQAKTKMQNGPI
jgi:hypothetical protein